METEEINENNTTDQNRLLILKQRHRGFNLIIFGAITLVGSMILSLGIDFSHPAFDYILFGATGLGATAVFVGLFMVLGF